MINNHFGVVPLYTLKVVPLPSVSKCGRAVKALDSRVPLPFKEWASQYRNVREFESRRLQYLFFFQLFFCPPSLSFPQESWLIFFDHFNILADSQILVKNEC